MISNDLASIPKTDLKATLKVNFKVKLVAKCEDNEVPGKFGTGKARKK